MKETISFERRDRGVYTPETRTYVNVTNSTNENDIYREEYRNKKRELVRSIVENPSIINKDLIKQINSFIDWMYNNLINKGTFEYDEEYKRHCSILKKNKLTEEQIKRMEYFAVGFSRYVIHEGDELLKETLK